MMAQAKANQLVDESELNALSPEFQTQIREVQALLKQESSGTEGKRRELPEGAPQEWLPKIVAEHKGHIVLFKLLQLIEGLNPLNLNCLVQR